MDHKTKDDQQHRLFPNIFPQLILTTGSQNTGPDIAVYTMDFGHMSPLKDLQHFFLLLHTPPEYLIWKLSPLAI